MKKILNNILSAFLLTLSLFQFSCKKFVEVNPPVTQLVSTNVFTTDSTAVAAMRGIYVHLVSDNFASGGLGSATFLCAASADELTSYSLSSNSQEFYQNALLSTNGIVETNLWDNPYNYIFAANAVIEGLNASKGVSSATKQQLTGEALFIRAFCHFYLVNLFGDVPLITSTNYVTNTNATRKSKTEVYQQIISDLSTAQSLLSTDYSWSGGARIRANKWAATALLARVYLYYGNLSGDANNYNSAETQASAVINNTGTYSLVADLNQVFLKNSTEAIWQLAPVNPQVNTNEANDFILTTPPSSSTGGVTLSNQLLNSFETGDNRKTKWISNYSSGGTTWYFAYKYKIRSGTSSITEYSMVLRLAEQYLIRADAKAQLGDASAVADLNVIRNRAGLSNYTGATDKTSLLTAILHERQVELFSEWGHRWLDLKRTGNVNSVMSAVTPLKGGSWSSNSALYPIPLTQLLNDPNMTNSQNPGY